MAEADARPTHVPDTDALARAIDQVGRVHGIVDASEPQEYGEPVAAVRRRRGRLVDGDASGVREMALIERDGVLLWVFSDEYDGGRRDAVRRRRGGRRAGAEPHVEGNLVKEVSVPVLTPNVYIEALARTDARLNPSCENGIRVVETNAKRKRDEDPVYVAESALPRKNEDYASTLLLVHGTFSSTANTLSEYASTPDGKAFLDDALERYDRVLAFDHATLSVSPFLNALDLARALAGTRGQLDVICHSRGGVVVRWWLEVLAQSLADAQVRAVFVGAPLNGTSLAAPNRIQPMISVLSNLGSFVAKAAKVAAATNPLFQASVALLKFVVRREANRWGVPPVDDLGERPDLDAAVAVIPGLQGQSAVSNNAELKRLRRPPGKGLSYYAVTADFEPERMGWKLWKVIREARARAPDAIADKIFDGPNDLVVDTGHMTSLTDETQPKKDDGLRITVCERFDGGQTDVHHVNYFQHPKTIAAFRHWLELDRA